MADATFLQDALPVSIHGAAGSTVNLENVLKQAFGENADSIASVQISYFDRTWLDHGNGSQSWQFWDPANQMTTKVLNNGQHTSNIHFDTVQNKEVFDFDTFDAAHFKDVEIKIGTNIHPNVIIRVDQGDGVFRDLSISTLPNELSPIFTTRPADHAPTAANIVATAEIFDAFSDKKGGIANAIDCHMIARDVAAAAGAPLDTLSYDAEHPENNQEGGFWRIAYRGTPDAPHNWQSLVQPGDIVRMQVTNSGNFHTVTVTGSMNSNGEIQVLDNQAGVISEHWANYDSKLDPTNPGSITIYRLTTDNMYLIDQSKDTHNTTIMGDNFNDRIIGGSGNNTLLGGKGADELFGGGGNDTLNGGTGADEMLGGSGDDVYIVDNAKDVVNEIRLLGFGGIDRVETTLSQYSLARSAQVVGSVENLTYTGTGDFTGTGNELDNEIVGGAGKDHLFGNDGKDTLRGGGGNDTLDGGAGADQMFGGKGDDVYIVDSADDMVNELSWQKLTPTSHLPTLSDSGGVDTVRTSLTSYSLNGAENSHIKGKIESLTYTGTGDFTGTGNGADNTIFGSSGNDHLFGKDGADTLVGGGGKDVLDGGTGADIMRGGLGDDIYIVDNANDVVDEMRHLGVHFNLESGSIDEVRTTLSDYSLSSSNSASQDFKGIIENLTFIGSGKFEGHGNGVGNIITGGDADDKLFGNAGDDTLIGGAGNDKLYGGSDRDVLIGGVGADTLTGDLTGGPKAADRFVFALGDNGVTARTADHITDFGKGDTLDVSDFVASHSTIEASRNFHGDIAEALKFANSELAKHQENGSAVLADSSSHNVYVFLDQDGDHRFESAVILDQADALKNDLHTEIGSHQLFM